MVKSLPSGGKLPANPKWIRFDQSDGDASRVPPNTKATPDADGAYNYMRLCDLDEGASINWRKTVGKEVARMMGKENPDDWVVEAWPAGYSLYDHNKGTLDNMRHDLYLCGSTNVNRFRSPNEIIPHAYWLLTDTTMNKENCECRYCKKTPQRVVSEQFNLSQTRGSSSSPHPGGGRVRTSFGGRQPNREKRAEKGEKKNARAVRAGQVSVPHTAVRNIPQPVLPKGPDVHMVPERDADIRATLYGKGLEIKRWAREHELVWVSLSHPIVFPGMPGVVGLDERVDIQFWPGLVKSNRLKSEAIPKASANRGSATPPSRKEKGKAKMIEDDNMTDDEEMPWETVQYHLYHLKLLGISKECKVPDTIILPYQAYAPPDQLIRTLQNIDQFFRSDLFSIPGLSPAGQAQPDDDDWPSIVEANRRILEEFASFQPILDANSPAGEAETAEHWLTRRFLEAAAPYSLALEIAAQVVGFYAPTDEWEHKWKAPPPDEYASVLSGNPPSTILEAERQAAAMRVAGTSEQDNAAAIPEKVWIQKRFQGLWWGAERVWVDEVVRLKIPRSALAPNGGPDGMVKKAAGPTEATKQFWRERHGMANPAEVGNQVEEDIDWDSLGAASRGVFMRLNGIFLAEVPKPEGGGMATVPRVCGMLYELVESDWTEPGGADAGAIASSMPGTHAEALSLIETTSSTIKSSSGEVTISPFAPAPAPSTPNGTSGSNTMLIESTAGHLPSVADGKAVSELSIATSAIHLEDTSKSLSQSAASDLANTITQSYHSGSLPPSQALPVELSERARSKLPMRAATAPSTPVAGHINGAEPIPAATSLHQDRALSGPFLPEPYPLPAAPTGFKFREILPPSREAVCDISLVAGRYYPQILSHALISPTLNDDLGVVKNGLNNALANPLGAKNPLWALEGLAPGLHNAVECTAFEGTRMKMITQADAVAKRELLAFWRRRYAERAEHLDQEGAAGRITGIHSMDTQESGPSGTNNGLPAQNGYSNGNIGASGNMMMDVSA